MVRREGGEPKHLGFCSCWLGDERLVAGVLAEVFLRKASWLKVSWQKGLLRQLMGRTPVGRFQEGTRCHFTFGEPNVEVGGAGGFLEVTWSCEGGGVLVLDSRL